jgi:hypothetical protein
LALSFAIMKKAWLMINTASYVLARWIGSSDAVKSLLPFITLARADWVTVVQKHQVEVVKMAMAAGKSLSKTDQHAVCDAARDKLIEIIRNVSAPAPRAC